MSSQNLFASLLMACLLMVGVGGLTPVADAASAGQSFLNPVESARNSVIEIKSSGQRPQIIRPIGPSYLYYDYPYQYERGYYPRHIGPGFIYRYPFGFWRDNHASYDDQCANWHRRCVANWGSGNADYHGCMKYHHCE